MNLTFLSLNAPQKTPFNGVASSCAEGICKLPSASSATLPSFTALQHDVFTPIIQPKFGKELSDQERRSIELERLVWQLLEEGMSLNEIKKRVKRELGLEVPFIPKPVPPVISDFIHAHYQQATPAAGVIEPIFTPRKQADGFSFNRRDRMRIFMDAAVQYFAKNPPKNGSVAVETLGNLIKAVENLAYDKAYNAPPSAPLGREFRLDPKYMVARDGFENWVLKVNGDHLEAVTDEANFAKRPDYVRILPSTGERTYVSGNGAILIQRLIPGKERFHAYKEAQRHDLAVSLRGEGGKKPSFSQMARHIQEIIGQTEVQQFLSRNPELVFSALLDPSSFLEKIWDAKILKLNPEIPDIHEGTVILSIPVNGKDAFGRPQSKAFIDPEWVLTPEQRALVEK